MYIRRNNSTYIYLVLIVLLFATTISGCGSLRPQSGNTEVSADSKGVKTAVVKQGDINVSISSNGLVVPISSVNLYYQDIAGPLKKLYVKQNDKVTAGQAIAEISPVGIRETIADQEANIKSWPIRLSQLDDTIANAKTNMEEAKAAMDVGTQKQSAATKVQEANDSNDVIKNDQEKQRLQTQYDQAEMNYQNARSAKEIANDQYEEEQEVFQFLSPSNNPDYIQQTVQYQHAMNRLKIQLSQAEEAVKAAKTNLDQAKASLDTYNKMESNSQVVKENTRASQQLDQTATDRQLKLQYAIAKSGYQNAVWNKDLAIIQYERDKNNLQKLKNDLGNSVLRTPISGQVIFVESLAVNEMVGSGRVIAKIAGAEKNVFQLTYTDAKYVSADTQAEIKIDNKKYQASAYQPQPGDQLIPTGSQTANPTFLFLKFISPIPQLETNKRFKADIRIYRNDTLLVPKAALKENGTKYSVDVLENGKIRTVVIERGLANDTMVEVLSGLQAGQKVVLGY